MAKASYAEKLRDPRWQKKRLLVMERDAWCCQSCYDPETTLHVHHRIYLANTDPWEYPDSLLVTLCEDCHKFEHDNVKDEERGLLLELYRQEFLVSELCDLKIAFHNLSQRLHGVPEVRASILSWALQDDDMMDLMEIGYREHLHMHLQVEMRCLLQWLTS